MSAIKRGLLPLQSILYASLYIWSELGSNPYTNPLSPLGVLSLNIFIRKGSMAAALAACYVLLCFALGADIKVLLPTAIILIIINTDYVVSIICFMYLLFAGEGISDSSGDE